MASPALYHFLIIRRSKFCPMEDVAPMYQCHTDDLSVLLVRADVDQEQDSDGQARDTEEGHGYKDDHSH